MPQVKWPKHKRKHNAWMGVLVAVLVIGSIWQVAELIRPATASAAAVLPNPALDSRNMSLAISQSNVGGVINSPQDYVKIYLDAGDVGTANVNIWNAPYLPCNNDKTQPDWTNPTDVCAGRPAAGALYDFLAMDANEDPGFATMTPLFTLNGQTGLTTNGQNIGLPGGGNWSGNIKINIASTNISNLTGFRVVLMRARFAAALPLAFNDQLHSYQIRTTGGLDQLGFWEAAAGSPPAVGQYVIHYLGAATNFDVPSTEFDFAPSCHMLVAQPAALKWYDADNSVEGGGDGTHGAWDTPPYFIFDQFDQNGVLQSSKKIDGTTVPDIGGNNAYKELPFTAQPGWKYTWVWHNLNGPFGSGFAGFGAANNVQMWLPFDSINYGLSCFDYHSTIAPALGTLVGGATPGTAVPLDFSNPALYTNMKYDVNIQNQGSKAGPPAFVTPSADQCVLVGGVYNCNPAPALTGGPTSSWVTTSPIPPTNPGGIPGGFTIPKVGNFAYSLSPNTPTGTIICFGDHIRPNMKLGDAGIDNDPPDQCYKVLNDRRSPSVVGSNSDIHAGGGICNQAQSAAPFDFIKGNLFSTGIDSDYGDYVVSAAGLISDFQSNGSGGTNTLTLGASGTYDTICRPDLYGYASTHPTVGSVSVGAGTYRIGTDPNFAGSVVFITAPATIDTNGGSLNHKLTIVTNSALTIDNNIVVGGAAGPRNTVASLGIIAAGNINIGTNATRVDAYMFSNATINTCDTGLAAPVPPQCDSTLVVNGFFMASALSLRRLGPLGSTSTGAVATTGEHVILNPEVYLNPPVYFDSSVDNISLQGQGERQPLY